MRFDGHWINIVFERRQTQLVGLAVVVPSPTEGVENRSAGEVVSAVELGVQITLEPPSAKGVFTIGWAIGLDRACQRGILMLP